MLARLREPGFGGSWPADTPGVRTGEAGAEDRGVLIRIQLRLAAGGVEAARFQAFGCPVAIACASWLAEWAKGRSAAELTELAAARLCRELELEEADAPTAELALAALRNVFDV